MSTGCATKIITLVLLVLFASTKVSATDIYHWIDENGVPHYSQYRPADNTPNVSKQTLEDVTPPGNDQLEDVYNVAAHEKRMAEWREELEQKREDARERKRATAQQQPIRQPEPYNDFVRPYRYPPIYNRPPHRPPHKPRPPIVKPSPPSSLVPRDGSR